MNSPFLARAGAGLSVAISGKINSPPSANGILVVLGAVVVSATTAYWDFLSLWKDAEPDIPILIVTENDRFLLDS
jgi:hypothetical protein